MNIAIACGGTGGHIFPGLATAQALRKRGVVVSLWLSGREVENVSIENWDGPIVTVKAEGFPSAISLRSIGIAIRFIGNILRCRKRMRENPPDVLLAMGSYASVGPVIAAWNLGIPVVLHEANAIPGRAVSFLARFASAIAITFPSASQYFRHKHIIVTRLPVRAATDARFEEGLIRKDGKFTVLVMGGSQGARRLNEITSAALCMLHRTGAPVQVIHLTGEKNESLVKVTYDRCDVPALVLGFLKDMNKAYNAADIAICRSGAGACMELAIHGIPALFVPLPSARRDHQMKNARVLEEAGAADVMEEKNVSPEYLMEYIAKCMENRERLDKMKIQMKNIGISDAAERLADLVIGQVTKLDGVALERDAMPGQVTTRPAK